MKNLFIMAVSAAILSVACSKLETAGVTSTKYVNVPGNYSGIIVEGDMAVEVSADNEMVEITSDSNVLPYIEIGIDDGNLVIKYEDGVHFSGRYETVIGLPLIYGVNDIRLSGAATYRQAEAEYRLPVRFDADYSSVFDFGTLRASEMILNLRNSSAFYADMAYVEDAVMTVSDFSGVYMDGHLEKCDADLANSCELLSRSRYRNNDLEISEFHGYLNDWSTAEFYSDGYLSGSLYGNSKICLYGGAAYDFNSDDTSQVIVR